LKSFEVIASYPSDDGSPVLRPETVFSTFPHMKNAPANAVSSPKPEPADGNETILSAVMKIGW